MGNILASIQGLEMKDTDNILQLKWSRKYKQNTYVLSLLKNTKKICPGIVVTSTL